jgi:hypothetical protein
MFGEEYKFIQTHGFGNRILFPLPGIREKQFLYPDVVLPFNTELN